LGLPIPFADVLEFNHGEVFQDNVCVY
jgi:hypothetical protein